MFQIQQFRRAAFRTLGLSVPALVLVCAAVVGIDNIVEVISWCPVQLFVAFVSMSAFIWWSSPVIAPRCAGRFFYTGCYFTAVFLVGSITGCLTSMLLYMRFDIADYVLKPLFWLSMFGMVPAFILGLVCAGMLRYSQRRAV